MFPRVNGVRLLSAAGIAESGDIPISAFFIRTTPEAITTSPTRYCGNLRFKFKYFYPSQFEIVPAIVSLENTKFAVTRLLRTTKSA